MVLLRKVIGDALRARRLAQHRTLREVSTAANVSLGYLSEIERGHKEASSELLASICDALGARLSDMLADVAAGVSLAERIEELAPAAASAAHPAGFGSGQLVGQHVSGDEFARDGFGRDEAVRDGLLRDGLLRDGLGRDDIVRDDIARDDIARDEVTDGELTVQVHSEGPLKTTLTAKRTGPSAPDQRPEPVLAS